VVPGGDRVLVVLHGHGDDPALLAHRRDELDPDHRATLVAPSGPVALEGGGRAWFHDHGAPGDGDALVAAVDHAIDEGIARATTGPATVALVGWSQGGAAALAYAVRASAPRLAGVATIAGWLPPVDGLEWAPRPDLRVLMVHGEDDEVVPLPLGRSAARFLEREGAEVTWATRPAGHRLEPAMTATVAAWLAALPRT
jgi:phospholipase/carboxylesterase